MGMIKSTPNNNIQVNYKQITSLMIWSEELYDINSRRLISMRRSESELRRQDLSLHFQTAYMHALMRETTKWIQFPFSYFILYIKKKQLITQRVGTPTSSAAESYLQTHDKHLWEHMKKYSLQSIEEGIHRLKWVYTHTWYTLWIMCCAWVESVD